MISPKQRPLLDNTQHSQKKDIHDPRRIRTRNLSKRAAADLRLRLRGHREHLLVEEGHIYFIIVAVSLNDLKRSMRNQVSIFAGCTNSK